MKAVNPLHRSPARRQLRGGFTDFISNVSSTIDKYAPTVNNIVGAAKQFQSSSGGSVSTGNSSIDQLLNFSSPVTPNTYQQPINQPQQRQGLSTGAKIGLAIGGVAIVGGIVYAVSK